MYYQKVITYESNANYGENVAGDAKWNAVPGTLVSVCPITGVELATTSFMI